MFEYRKEALEYQNRRVDGEILILPSIKYQACVCLVVMWLSLMVVWSIWGTFNKKETVLGWVEPSVGVAGVFVPRSGKVSKVYVQEGDAVTAGDLLFEVDVTTSLNDGSSLDENLSQRMQERLAIAKDNLTIVNKRYESKERQLHDKLLVLNKSLESILEKELVASKRLEISRDSLQRLERLLAKGFVTKTDFQNSELELLSLEADFQRVRQEKASVEGELKQAGLEKKLMYEEAQRERNAASSEFHFISSELVKISSEKSYSVKATRDGIVAAMDLYVGAWAFEQKKTMTILPHRYQLIAKLILPVSASGFVEKGQKVKLRYDSFPFQKYGVYEGEIRTISEVVTLPTDHYSSPISIIEPSYIVAVDIEQQGISAFGRHYPLKPGATLTADVFVGDQSLIDWVIEPLKVAGSYL
ncbi:MAG: HlyD family efflux transporter periplasmic adaptor subunit [Cellvibrionaceae bacterium]|nr:HlyD family efflux transporter periplasmic adaptor subunit [Cellvibrionaceae bacterium]